MAFVTLYLILFFAGEENKCYWETTFLMTAQLKMTLQGSLQLKSQWSAEAQEEWRRCQWDTDQERRHRVDGPHWPEQGRPPQDEVSSFLFISIASTNHTLFGQESKIAVSMGHHSLRLA